MNHAIRTRVKSKNLFLLLNIKKTHKNPANQSMKKTKEHIIKHGGKKKEFHTSSNSITRKENFKKIPEKIKLNSLIKKPYLKFLRDLVPDSLNLLHEPHKVDTAHFLSHYK